MASQVASWSQFLGHSTGRGAKVSQGSHSQKTDLSSGDPGLLGVTGQRTQEEGTVHTEREFQRSAEALH